MGSVAAIRLISLHNVTLANSTSVPSRCTMTAVRNFPR